MEFAHEGILEAGTGSREAYSELASAMGITSDAPPSQMTPRGGSKGFTITPCDGSAPPGLKKLAMRKANADSDSKHSDISSDYVPGSGEAAARPLKSASETNGNQMSRAKLADDWAKKLLIKKGQRVPRPINNKPLPPAKVESDPSADRDGDWSDIGALNGCAGPAMKTADTSFYDAISSANPVKLALILLRNFERRWLEWEPETLWTELAAKAGAEVPQRIRDKIQAMRLTLTTSRFYEEWPVFEKVTVAFNDREPKFKVLQHVSPEEMARSVVWARQLNEQPFEADVLAYIAAVCQMEGLICLPEPLAAAQPFLDGITADQSLCPQVRELWEEVKDVPIDQLDLDPGAVSIQIFKMASIARAAEAPATQTA